MVDQMRWSQHGEQSKLFWREKTKRWYAKAIEASFLLNDPEKAFYFMEKSRAVLLNDKLAELGAKNKLPASEAETERSLRIKLSFIASRAGETSDLRVHQDLREATLDLHSFIQQLEKRYPAYYAYKYDTTVFSLMELQASLKPAEEAWIELFDHDSTIFALAVSSDRAALHKIHFPGHHHVAKRISDLCSERSLINRNFKKYRELSYLYFKNVFKPLNISAARVTVSQDEYFLPFEVLMTDSTDQMSVLLKDHAFSYAYSAGHVLRSKTSKTSVGNSLLAIAPVTYNSRLELQELHGSDQSLEQIRSMYSEGMYLTKTAATKRIFLQQIPTFHLIHIYSHATADSLGQEPAIFFYDSALHLSELQNLPNLKTRLIVLSACNTGVGKTIKGEGVLSLARGFAAAGIPSTISALWEIDNFATYEMSELFFKNLSAGQPSDLALQQAKLQMLKSDNKEYQLPYFWAGTVLIGKAESFNSNEANSIPNSYMYFIVGVVGCLSAAIIFKVRRKRNGKITARPQKEVQG
jgi:hypothetical protein